MHDQTNAPETPKTTPTPKPSQNGRLARQCSTRQPNRSSSVSLTPFSNVSDPDTHHQAVAMVLLAIGSGIWTYNYFLKKKFNQAKGTWSCRASRTWSIRPRCATTLSPREVGETVEGGGTGSTLRHLSGIRGSSWNSSQAPVYEHGSRLMQQILGEAVRALTCQAWGYHGERDTVGA